MKYYTREIERVLLKAVKQFRIVVLTGARQTGKSTLLQHLFLKTHKYISLDDPKILKLAAEDPELFFQEFKQPLIIDEIQYAPQLLKYIKMLVDKSSKRGQFILTGSQQFTLMKGLQETLAGRAAIFYLLPMSFEEGKISTRNYKFRALTGSFPELIAYNKIDPDRWYASYINTYIEKDVQMHYRIEKTTYFRDLIFLLAARTSQLLNYQSLSNELGVSNVIIKSWIKILEASQIIYLLKPYYINLGNRITKSPKLYFTDIGLVSYITGNRSNTSLYRGPQSGALFENYVLQEILKRYANRGQDPRLFFYRNNTGLEVDLLIEDKPGNIMPCEIKMSKTPHKGMANSIKRLRILASGKKNMHIKPGLVISLVDDPYPLSKEDKACSLKDFINTI